MLMQPPVYPVVAGAPSGDGGGNNDESKEMRKTNMLSHGSPTQW
jgi:hypothetical protein